ncbi:hypothetical protein BDA99DRAFT_547171 [Phascolomyces articulosus]|uniref:Uncharacterized protein n=1 Tax=Phascolomyces articulosus TaxID=60185 RepID=A0AAD5JZV9_9FUNG|nr:hypothetical protein BDA99DRAFT_547171 [Phascolomyces articulosus]
MDIIPKKRKADELSTDEDDRKIQQVKLEQNGHVMDTKVCNDDSIKPTDEQQPASVVPFDRLIVLHVEATCDENLTNPAAIQVTKVDNNNNNKLSFVVLDTNTMKVIHEQKIAVRPERTPLTNFCTQITHITWEQLSSAGTFKDAIREFDQYVQEEILSHNMTFCFVTHGGWILRIQMAREAMDKNLELPDYLAMYQMFDLKQEVQRWQMQHHPEISLRTTSLTDLCEAFHIERSSTEDPALTVAQVVRHLTSFRHPDVFTKPIQYGVDWQRFKNEESKVVRLAGLPYELTQGELEAWFSSNGLRPTTTWMIQTTEHSKPSLSGFVLFQTHDEASRALRLNGRCLSDRPIEVAPTIERVIEQASGLLTSFPVQANNRRLRPGDWMCPNCSFHNFASRRNCFKCNTESPHVSSSSGGAGIPGTTKKMASNFTPGDWLCPNTTCQFHNYSSRYQCWKCGTDRPQATSASNSAKSTTAAQAGSTGTSTSTPTTPTGPASATLVSTATSTPTGPAGMSSSSGALMTTTGTTSSSTTTATTVNGMTHTQSTTTMTMTMTTPSTATPPMIPSSRHSIRPGDWFCPNPECCFQNFASRTACYRCHTPNPHPPAYPQHYGYTDPTTGAATTASPYPPSAQYRAGDWIW